MQLARYIMMLCFGMAWLWCFGSGQGAAADQGMSDSEKIAKIAAMYRDYKKEFADVPDIEASEALRLSREGRALFIDVREEKEQAVSMLPGAVTEKQFSKDPSAYRGPTLIAYCTISYRSGKLAQKLRAQGLTVLNLEGGLLAWVHAGGTVYDKNGETKRIHVYGRKWNLAPKDYEAVW